jgi:hypothetical protein
MTTQKWIKKQISFAIRQFDNLEDLKIHLQMILTRLKLSPLERDLRMQLCDRADGVEGHYCIGRPIGDSIYWEYYNEGKWCSAGEVFIGRDRAEKMLFALQASGE